MVETRARSSVNAQEQLLIELSQWLARVQQYSLHHPACEKLGERTHAALIQALEFESQLQFGVLRDGIMIGGEVAALHPSIRTKLAPHLHARGVLVLRFVYGASLEEVQNLVELLTLPVQTTFDRGGLTRLAMDRGIHRVQIDEIAHDITAEEREAQRRRKELRTFFAEMLRRVLLDRMGDPLAAGQLGELLSHPEIAITILEEDPIGVADALAGLCLMVREEEARSGVELYPKLKTIMLGLAPPSQDRVVLGLPALVAEFRQSLVWALDGLSEEELARFAFSSFRRHAADLDLVLYAISVAVPHDGRRLSTLRSVALRLYDVAFDDAAGGELLAVASRRAEDFDSYRRERDCLQGHATRALASRVTFASVMTVPTDAAEREQPAAFDGRRVMTELVKMSARTRSFDRACARLPYAVAQLTGSGSSDAVAGIIRGLREIDRPQWKELANATLREVVTPEMTARFLGYLDNASANVEGAELHELVSNVQLLVALSPDQVFERLELSESRRMRRILLEALSLGGPSILPLARKRLESQHWFVVRNAVALLPRLGGAPRELSIVSRHPHDKVRLEVVRALRGMTPDEATGEIIAAYITDPSSDVRRYSLPMLRGELLSHNAVFMLDKIANDEAQHEELRRRVITALGRSHHDAAAKALFDILQPRGLLDASPIRDSAAVALRGSPAPRARMYFEEGLKSPERRVRKACEKAAGG